MYRETVNTVFNLKRKMTKHRHTDPLEDNSDDSIERIPAAGDERYESSQEVQETIVKAVGSLPQHQRTVLVLKHMESVKIKDIAALARLHRGDCQEVPL
tara:strand:- start:4689 stop:4985 length:297 start_codon:yes stop_codon:yes gene_type:complete